jgi:DNA-binding beta-propeller fold protein YncE
MTSRTRAKTFRSRRIALIALSAALWPLSVPAGAQVPTTANVVWGQNGSFNTFALGIEANSLSHPQGIAVDSGGNVYVVDTANNRVLYFPSGSTTATRV